MKGECADPSICQNGGTCFPIGYLDGYECKCPNGTLGLHCETSELKVIHILTYERYSYSGVGSIYLNEYDVSFTPLRRLQILGYSAICIFADLDEWSVFLQILMSASLIHAWTMAFALMALGCSPVLAPLGIMVPHVKQVGVGPSSIIIGATNIV